MAPTHKFCARCNRKHAAPTGKRKCRLPIDDFLDTNNFESLALTGDEEGAMGGPPPFEEVSEHTPEPSAAEVDVHADTLSQILSVVSHLADKIEVTQQQVVMLQSDRQLLHRSQGAIPKAQKMGHQASAPPPGSSLPTLESLRCNVLLSAQASSLVNSLEMGLSGTNCTHHNYIDSNSNSGSSGHGSYGNVNSNISNTSSKRGWARPGRGQRHREAPPRDPVRAAGVLVPGVPTHAGRTTVDRAPETPDLASTTARGSAHSVPTILPTALCGNTYAAGAGPRIT
jgi:hypothetical protein